MANSWNFTADGTQEAEIAIDDEFSVSVQGTFGGGTLAIKHTIQGNDYVFAGGETGTFTAANERVFRNSGDTKVIKAVLTGATSPDLDVSIANNVYGA